MSNSKKKTKVYRGPSRNQRDTRDRILEAWAKGTRTFEEVVEITGYTEKQVSYYLPRYCKL